MAGLRFLLPMLHPRCYHRQRTVRGQSNWLSSLCRTLSFPIPSRFIPALSLSPFSLVTSGFRGSALLAIEPGRRGDLTDSDAVRWQLDRGTPYVPSPLLYGERLDLLSVNTAVLSCYQADSGEPDIHG